MAAPSITSDRRTCTTCGAIYAMNPRYSAAKRARSRFCSRKCAGLATEPVRRAMSQLLGGRERFGQLTFIEEGKPCGRQRRGRFRCDCGTVKDMLLNHIRAGKVISCGCEGARRSASRFTKHGAYSTPTYKTWNAMMQRCHNPDNTSFPRYGGRGIAVDPAWHGPEGFHRFLAYVGPRPAGTSIERIDNDKGYRPGNVRWATAKEQQNNRGLSRIITFDGKAMNVRDWSRHLGMGKNTVDARLRAGWSVERALTEPVHKSGEHVAEHLSDGGNGGSTYPVTRAQCTSPTPLPWTRPAALARGF